MKPIPFIIGVCIGAAVSIAACSQINSARESQRHVQLLSDVHDPLRLTLDDIVATDNRGDRVLAVEKTRLLQQRWSEFLKEGRTPEQFAEEIMQLGRTSTRATQ